MFDSNLVIFDSMKYIFKTTFSIALLSILVSCSSVEHIISTRQSLTAGYTGTRYTNFEVHLKADTLVIDSVYFISLNKKVKSFTVKKNEKKEYVICFDAVVFAGREDIPQDIELPQVTYPEVDFSKGVIVFYTSGNKKSKLKISAIKSLPDLDTP